MYVMKQLLSRYFPLQTDLSHRHIFVSSMSALVAIMLVTFVCQLTLAGSDVPLMVASVGASAVLLFIVPSSTLSSPWAFLGGHVISALIGVSCAQWIPILPLATAVAVSLAMLAMFYLRCLHPPGGAVALLAVLGGESVQNLGYQFVVMPVLLNVVVMLACAMLYWQLTGIGRFRSAGRQLGLDQDWQRGDEDWLVGDAPFSTDDLSQAMAEMDTFFDISQHDLEEIYARAMHQSHKHSLKGLCCAEIMSQPAVSVEYGIELATVWEMFEQHGVRGLPVVDSFQRVLGIVTVSDFVRVATQHQPEQGKVQNVTQALLDFRQRTPGFESNKAEVVGQIMSAPVITAETGDQVSELAALLSGHGIHHLPIVDERRRLVGIITREDIMTARAGHS
jgi:CBS domain-containing membrane protein